MQAAKKKRDPLIRTRLRRIVLTPTAALIVLWLIVTAYLGYDAALQYSYAQASNRLVLPSAMALNAVMDERSATVAYLDRPEENKEALADVREEVDQHMTLILDEFQELLPLAPEPAQKGITRLSKQFAAITDLRARVDVGQALHEEVEEYYNRLLANATDLFDVQARAMPDAETVGPLSSGTQIIRAVDMLAQADAELSHGFATGELSMEDQHDFIERIGAYRGLLGAADDLLASETQSMLSSLQGSEEYIRMERLIHELSNRQITTEFDPYTGQEVEDLSVPVDEEEWRSVYLPVKDSLTEIGIVQTNLGLKGLTDSANQSVLTAALGSLGVAVMTAVVLLVATRSSQRLVNRLIRLRDQTQELADRRLPDLVERLKDNEPVDIAAEILPLSDSDDEIGQVARSFNAAQRTAVEAVVQQAQLRQGVNRVFLNIAHRSQTLVHRQLRLLDKLEREQEDPDQLTDLFKLDHLATRARRNAENLLILGGQSPGRTWHQPMPLIDVLRGAISESGDYSRVKRQRIAPVSVQGGAVADVIHLIAELVDNATTFSPPHTKVHLRGDRVPNGVTVEIEDRGLGMKEDELEAANELLANPPEFDIMRLNEKTRLGLFVVSHLAHRHNIRVQLRPSPYGGVLAIVLLPLSLIADPQSGPVPLGTVDSAAEADGGALPPSPSEESGPASGPQPVLSRPTGDMLAGPPAPAESAVPPPPSAAPLPRRVPGVSTFPSVNGAADNAVRPSTRPAPAAEQRPEVTPTDGRPPLPRRIPQVNLAPQLFEDPSTGTGPSPKAGSPIDDPERPARLRETLNAFQQGTRRGREDGRKRLNETEKDS
ncbi:sensor histidine kinase [Thermobifida cellulosilytica]|uniref:histidine kinase n=1 Tax=Thermobifida cellulosilytica TB100 TaxID=665004 RepID=A0A147KEK9_THECS|nr:nitrate- and nitrite sensing domain-containing protein [Thermobifida cellulosilytica]KUP95725.1 ATP-binding protein [Thermobifida cellulosilytica TB100]